MFNEERERQYMAIVEHDREAIKVFPKLLALTTAVLNNHRTTFWARYFKSLN